MEPNRKWRAAQDMAFPSVVALALVVALLALGCAPAGDRAPAASGTPGKLMAEEISWMKEAAPPSPAVNDQLVAQGAQLFAENCSACHGTAGDGAGVCAPFMAPQPRDFTSGTFRFKTTPGGEMPSDSDVFKTVSAGLHGTGMPPWRFLLTDQERWAVVHYIKTFSGRFADLGPGTPVDLGAAPEVTPERIDAGRTLYAEAGCGQCHGTLGYGDGPAALTLVDDFGKAVLPRNFHKIGQFKRGYTLVDVALTVHTGNNGTPMPAFQEVYSSDQIWNIAAYVLSLGERKMSGGGTPASATQGAHLGEPDVVVQLFERNWNFVPSEIRVRQGQLVRVDFQPTDNGVGAGHGFAIDGYDQDAFINGAMVQRPKSVTFRADKAGTFVFYCSSQCSTGDLHPNMKGKLVVEPSSQAAQAAAAAAGGGR